MVPEIDIEVRKAFDTEQQSLLLGLLPLLILLLAILRLERIIRMLLDLLFDDVLKGEQGLWLLIILSAWSEKGERAIEDAKGLHLRGRRRV